MGIIRAAVSAAGGNLADQWLETIQPDNMTPTTLMSTGVAVRKDDRRNQNKKGSQNLITDGSVIHVGQNMCMLLVDGGKIVDYSAEPGYFTVDNKSAPSLFNGQLKESLEETFERVRFGGVSPHMQTVYYINTQEIRDIPFGTQNPINYFDSFYNAELYLRAHGYFSIRIVDPLLFFGEAADRSSGRMEINDLRNLYLAEFLSALQTAIAKMSVDGIRISHVSAKSQELGKYMADVLDQDWTARRGLRIESVGIASIAYDEESKKLINIRNQGAVLSDPSVREGYVQGAAARGIEAAGSNQGGAVGGFVGVGMGMQATGGFVAGASAANQEQMRREAQAKPKDTWKCSCGNESTGQFCPACGSKKPESWQCACGTENSGNFCSRCGEKRPQQTVCPQCKGAVPAGGKFCPACGQAL
jgi:Putative virion core protein (lumpy skin disease virus)